MLWQLGNAVGKKAKEAYAIVAEEDKLGVSPGSAKLAILFEKYGPALILIDQWVAYARQIYGKENLPGGSFIQISLLSSVNRSDKICARCASYCHVTGI